jgi:hypothetical protein
MKNITPIIITPDGRIHPILPDHNGQVFQLKQLQAIVGGYIEVVTAHDGRRMVINEEGKLKGLPINLTATKLYRYGDYDSICGDVLVCHGEYLGED